MHRKGNSVLVSISIDFFRATNCFMRLWKGHVGPGSDSWLWCLFRAFITWQVNVMTTFNSKQSQFLIWSCVSFLKRQEPLAITKQLSNRTILSFYMTTDTRLLSNNFHVNQNSKSMIKFHASKKEIILDMFEQEDCLKRYCCGVFHYNFILDCYNYLLIIVIFSATSGGCEILIQLFFIQ